MSSGGSRWARLSALALFALVAMVAWGLWLRLEHARTALYFGDEWHTLTAAALDFPALVRSFDRFGTGIGMPLCIRALTEVAGSEPLVVRLPALAGGFATLLGLWWYGRRFLDPCVARLAVLLVALSSCSIFYSSFARSYSVVCALALLLACAVTALAVAGERSLRGLAVVAVACALLPYFHLTAAASALAIGAGGVLALLVEGRRRLAAELGAAVAVGLILAALMHVPARDSLMDFVGRKSKQKYAEPFGVLDIAAVLAGSRTLALVLFACLLPACVAFRRAGPARALPWLGAIVGPPVAVALVRPFGDAYAYARYVMASVPFLALLLAWGITAGARALLRDRPAAELAATAGGIAMACAAFWSGPLGARHTPDGVFAHSYISLHPLPAFDAPFDGAPEIYREIAADGGAERVLEVPHLIHRGVLLYRNYFLAHRKRVQTAFLRRAPEECPRGYPTLVDPAWRDQVDADWVVLHLNAVREVERYWEFVYADARANDPATAAYMRRHEKLVRGEEVPDQEVVQRIAQELGPVYYRDQDVLVWKL